MGDDVQDQDRLRRLVGARAELLRRHRESPVQSFESKMARLTAAKKREQERVAHLVLGEKRPDPELVRPEGMSRQQWKIERKRLRDMGSRLSDPEIEARLQIKERWSHKNFGTPETWERDGLHTDALIQLQKNGTLDNEQVEWAAQISNVHRSIESDTTVKIASFEARVDQSVRPPAIAERIHRVRMHRAYTFWRDMLPAPKSLVLDMIVGDTIGYTVAARRHRVHNRKALRLLVDAINRWPLSVAQAFSVIDQDMVNAMNRAERPYALDWPAPAAVSAYLNEQMMEPRSDRTDEPYLLPKLDPEFIDERGFLRPWAELAAIIRERVFAPADAA